MEGYSSIEEFTKQVREALSHLHDYAYLQGCSLCTLFFPGLSLEGSSRAQRVRRLLLETIEELSPPDQVPVNSKEWRGYHILSSRYIERREHQEVIQELAISERQFYREQRRIIEALAQLLCEKHRWIEECQENRETTGPAGHEGPGFQTLYGEAERLASQSERIQLEGLMQGVLRAVGPLARKRGLAISYHLNEHLPAIYANRTLVRQILIQTLSRCITQPGITAVHVGFGRRSREIGVEFTSFVSPGAEQHTVQDLSLNTVQHLVEMVGGQWYETSVGRGQYHLQFTLPTSEPRTLLVIEDNPAAVQLLRRYLVHQNYRVADALNSDEALRLTQDLEPDVIILDLMMPRQDGWEVLEILRRNPALQRIPVLICSVLDEPQVALAMGASAYLKKPFSQTQLLEVLDSLGGSENHLGLEAHRLS